ncbi:MAG TPA: hypothetical protein VFF08_00270 [Trueperaceae bacterium]|jgi:uncharacterized protein (DUF697 family)|nr:hypothetical protein [Trueperaceae bacterium]
MTAARALGLSASRGTASRSAARSLPRTLAELDEVRRECRALVNRSAGISGLAAVVPVPGADVGVDVTLFMQLLPAINRRFGLTPEQVEQLDARTKELVFLGVTSVGSQAIARLVTADVVAALLRRIGVRIAAKSAAKWVPVVGSAAAAGISYTAMRLVGNRHVDDCYRVVRAVIERSGPVLDVPAVPRPN